MSLKSKNLILENQGDTVEEFVSKVDKALYEAKETGRNKVVAGK